MSPIVNLFRSPSERHREGVLKSLEVRLQSAERRVAEAYDYADGLVRDWERERDAILAGYRHDRRNGDQWPYLRNMEDLRYYRGMSRVAVDGNSYGAGFLDRAIDFVIGDGMEPQVTLRGARKGAVSTGIADADQDGQPDADPRVEAVQRVIDEFRELNDWGRGCEDREEEGFRRQERDGEVFVRFFENGYNGIPYVRWVEPELIDSPPSALPEERWGVRHKKGDVETVEAFYVYDSYDQSFGGEWVDGWEIVRSKVGTDRTVLRGLPQFWLVAKALEQCEKLNNALTEVAAIQAAIAYVRQHAPGTLPSQITSMVSGDYTEKARGAPGRDRYQQVSWTDPGQVVDMTSGMNFLPGPVSTGVPAFVQGLQSRLRQVCARFGYPEFFTGDASNNNFASSLVSGGPAERAFKRRQNKYANFQADVYKRACQYAVKAGRLSEAEYRACEITVKPGTTSIANKLEEAQLDQILIQNKVKSVQTVMLERGLDPRVETANIEAWDSKFGMGAMGLGGGGGDQFGGGDGGDGGGEPFDPTAESYTEDEYHLLTEAQKNLLVQQDVTVRRGGRTFTQKRWVKAGGTMDETPAGADVQRAKLVRKGKGADAKKAEPKAAPKDKAEPKAEPKAAKTRDQLDYLPSDPKRLTVDQAHQALADLGVGEVVRTVGGTGPDDPPVTVVKTPGGEEKELSIEDVKVAIYGPKALPKVSRLNGGDLARLFARSGAGRLVRAAKVGADGKASAWVVRDPDGRGERTVSDAEVRRAVAKAGLARESYTQDEYEALTYEARDGLVDLADEQGVEPDADAPEPD